MEKPISKWAKSRKPPFFHIGNIFIAYSARVKPHTHHWVTVLVLHLCYNSQYGAIVDIILASESTIPQIKLVIYLLPLTTCINFFFPLLQIQYNSDIITWIFIHVTRVHEKNTNVTNMLIFSFLTIEKSRFITLQ